GWALLDANGPAPWLHRFVVLLTVLIVLGAVYASGLAGITSRRAARREPAVDQPAVDTSGWADDARRLGPSLPVLASLVMGVILVQEFFLYDPHPDVRKTPMALPAMLLVAGLLAAVTIGCVWIAVSRRNPFALSSRGRLGCVYGAEV